MDPEYDYKQCLAAAKSARMLDRDSHQSVCKFYWNKMSECKKECNMNESSSQESIFRKCLVSVTTDKQLDECIKKNMVDSTINVCKSNCDLRAIQNLRALYVMPPYL